MPSQIKIELRRRGARASGQKADLVQYVCIVCIFERYPVLKY